MKLINRKSDEVLMNGGRAVTRQYLTVEDNRIYFTSSASKTCELKAGLFVQFLNEGKEWAFFVNTDSDGFLLTVVTAKNGFHVTNAGLARLILKSTGGFQPPKRFLIEKTGNMQDKCPVFKMTLTLNKQRSRI